MAARNEFSAQVRERAGRMVLERRSRYASQSEAIRSIAGELGCVWEALRKRVRRAENDAGKREGVTSDQRSWHPDDYGSGCGSSRIGIASSRPNRAPM
jgi:transposase-like protein